MVPDGSGNDIADQFVCKNNQLQAQSILSECEYGCDRGACKQEPLACEITEAKLELNSEEDIFEFESLCQSNREVGNMQIQLLDPNKNILKEYPSTPGTTPIMGNSIATYIERSDLETGEHTIHCIIEDKNEITSCVETIFVDNENLEDVVISHFELFRDNDLARTNNGYDLELVVVATNSDGSIASDYDGQGLIIVTGDDDADFPQSIDLELTDGVGFFPINLMELDDVTITYKDVENHLKGSSDAAGLTIYTGDDRRIIS